MDNEGTDPFDPNEGADETTPLNPHRDEEEMEMSTRTSTSTTERRGRHTAETSFIGETPRGRIYSERMRIEEMKDEAEGMIKNVFPNADTSKFFARIDDHGQVRVSIKRLGVWHPILDENGEVLINDGKGKFPKTLRNALGKNVLEIARDNIAENDKAETRVKELDDQIANTFGEERKRLVEEREIEQEGINEKNRENEAIEEKLSLKQRIKEIFKKHGFTIIAVSAAVATVIGVIVSSLKSGLTKVAKGVGNGLKNLGEKLGQILPGMIGTIASFIF